LSGVYPFWLRKIAEFFIIGYLNVSVEDPNY